MKALASAFHKWTRDELRRLWLEATFVFDTSMLLNVYRYSPETQDLFFNVLETLRDRIWIPLQVATEFFNNREGVIEAQLKAYDEIDKILAANYENLQSQLGSFRRHTCVKTDPLLQTILEGMDQARELLEADRQQHPDFSSSDPLRDRIVALFDGKVGPEFDTKRQLEIHKEAELRFSLQKPPGYTDSKKPIPERYGDLVLWFQIIAQAKSGKAPIVFVTDEKKKIGGTKRIRPCSAYIRN